MGTKIKNPLPRSLVTPPGCTMHLCGSRPNYLRGCSKGGGESCVEIFFFLQKKKYGWNYYFEDCIWNVIFFSQTLYLLKGTFDGLLLRSSSVSFKCQWGKKCYGVRAVTLWSNQIGTVRKRTSFISLQLLNNTFIQNSEQIITFARHKYRRVGVFRIKIRSLVQKL